MAMQKWPQNAFENCLQIVHKINIRNLPTFEIISMDSKYLILVSFFQPDSYNLKI